MQIYFAIVNLAHFINIITFIQLFNIILLLKILAQILRTIF